MRIVHYFLVTQIADRSRTSTGLSVYVYGRLHKVLTLPATILLAKTIMYVPLGNQYQDLYKLI